MTFFWRMALLGLALVCLQGKVLAETVAISVDPETALGQLVGDREITFYAIDVSTGQDYVYDLPLSQVRNTPFSSFKIPHLLIALETGAVSSLQAEKPWDASQRPAQGYWPDSWRRSHTMATAFKKSVPWYFQEITRDIDGSAYRLWLTRLSYGNAEAPEGSDDFWLNGPLVISPMEQARFLAKLAAGSLPVSPRHVEALKSVALLEVVGTSRLYGKTGAGPVDNTDFDGEFAGWLVGWVESDKGGPVSYALYVRGPSFAAIRELRRQAAILFLQEIQALPR